MKLTRASRKAGLDRPVTCAARRTLVQAGGRSSAMKIVVLVKQVPDSGVDRNLRTDDNTVDRGSANNVINEMDEYAIEEALRLREAHGGEVVLLTMGPERAAESIRKAL